MKINFLPQTQQNPLYFGNRNPQAMYLNSYKKFEQNIEGNRHAWKLSFDNFRTNCKTMCSTFKEEGLTLPVYLKCVARYPIVICENPARIINNVNSVVKEFKEEGLTKKDYVKACIKQPVNFLLAPETVKNNIRGTAKIYENNGLSVQEYLKLALKQPSLFGQTPQGISRNIDTVVQRFSQSGLDTDSYIKAIKKYPTIACLCPSTVERNVSGIVEEYSKYGLTEEKYIKILKMYEMGFTCNSDNKINGIKRLVKNLSDMELTEQKCIHTFIRQPGLFTCNLDNIESHIRLLDFIEREKFVDAGKEMPCNEEILDRVLNKSLAYSDDMNYLIMMKNKLKERYHTKLPYRGLKNNFPDFIRENAGRTFELDISKSPFTDDFLKFVDKYSKEIAGRNIFKFILR